MIKITVSGQATLKVDYSVDFEMTEEQWDSMTEKQQNDMLDHRIDWLEQCRGAEVDYIEVEDVVETAE